MENEEIRSTIEQVKAQIKAKPENKDKTDDEIDEIVLDGFLEALDRGDMEKEDLLGIMDLMGYEPTEEFEKALNEGEGESEGEAPYENMSKEELEDAKAIPEGSGEEGVEEFKEDIEEETEKAEDDEEDDEDEDAQREEASKLFGVDLRKNK